MELHGTTPPAARSPVLPLEGDTGLTTRAVWNCTEQIRLLHGVLYYRWKGTPGWLLGLCGTARNNSACCTESCITVGRGHRVGYSGCVELHGTNPPAARSPVLPLEGDTGLATRAVWNCTEQLRLLHGVLYYRWKGTPGWLFGLCGTARNNSACCTESCITVGRGHRVDYSGCVELHGTTPPAARSPVLPLEGDTGLTTRAVWNSTEQLRLLHGVLNYRWKGTPG